MNADRTEIVSALSDFVTKELSDASVSISADDDLLEGSLVNSLGVMRLVAYIEEQYKYAVPAGDITIENFSTINHIANYLVSNMPPGE